MTCCVTVREIVDEVYTLLGDPDRERWTVAQLVTFINEALCEILTYRPDEFAVTTEITLQPGRLQRVPDGYRQLISLEYNIGGDETPIQETAESIQRTFVGRPCRLPSSACYVVQSWSRNSKDRRTFYVNPPVPKGVTHRVVATLVANPPKHDKQRLDDCLGIDCAYRAQVVDWVMARALEVDVESERNASMITHHKQAFYTALGVDYLQESRFNSGNWLGRTAQDEPNQQVGTQPAPMRR